MAMFNWMTRGWDPHFDFSKVTDEMDRMFSDVHRALSLRSVPRGTFPAMNVYESADKVTVKAEIPGVSKDDLDLEITGNLLTLKGKRENRELEKDVQSHRFERVSGRFSRTLSLPEDIDPDLVEADYSDGVLTVVVGKREEVLPKKVEIKAISNN